MWRDLSFILVFHFRVPYKNIGFRMSVDYIYIIFYKIIRLYIFLIFSKKFMVNFTHIIFVYLCIIPHYVTKFQKNPQSGFQTIRLCSFGPKNQDQICSFVSNRHFLVNFTHAIFVYLLSLIMVQSFKRILRAYSKIFNKV